MKKYFTLLLIIFVTTMQKINAQLDLAFVSSISVTADNSSYRLNWTVANNKGATTFNVQRSVNGKDFETISVLIATEKHGSESYTYSDTITSTVKTMYRLEMLTKAQHTFYSRIVMIEAKIPLNYSVKVIGNPISDKLSFNYSSKNQEQVAIRIFNLSGMTLLNQKIGCFKGNNLITIPLTSGYGPGTYVIEISNSILRLTTPFIKQ